MLTKYSEDKSFNKSEYASCSFFQFPHTFYQDVPADVPSDLDLDPYQLIVFEDIIVQVVISAVN